MDEDEILRRALGKAVQERRKTELGLTQEAMANEGDLNQAWISHVENGRHALNLWNLRRLATALGITRAELLARAERHERDGHLE